MNVESETARVKYVYLDVVRFAAGRSVEAQSYIVDTMNNRVRDAAKASGAPDDQTIFIPTGDGIAIALIEVPAFDIHIKIGLRILKALAEHDASPPDKTRSFQLRIGVNECVDNIITDINDRRNVAGRGIALAQRIVDKADGNQILAGEAVYDALRSREYYINSFRGYSTVDKHGESFTVYQFHSNDHVGLNGDPPRRFTQKVEKPKPTKFCAYYVAHAAAHKDFLLSNTAGREESGSVRASVQSVNRLALRDQPGPVVDRRLACSR